MGYFVLNVLMSLLYLGVFLIVACVSIKINERYVKTLNRWTKLNGKTELGHGSPRSKQREAWHSINTVNKY